MSKDKDHSPSGPMQQGKQMPHRYQVTFRQLTVYCLPKARMFDSIFFQNVSIFPLLLFRLHLGWVGGGERVVCVGTRIFSCLLAN